MSRGDRAGGFILVATLWVLAGLTVLAAYIDGVAADNVERAMLVKETIALELERRSTEATLVYLLATNRVNYRGFILDDQQRFADRYPEELPLTGDGELWVTDVPYRGVGETLFGVQDENGLISVNLPGAGGFAALMKNAGVSPVNLAQMVARAGDYVDRDGQLSLNGAEYFDYLQSGRPPPANWVMMTPLEAQLVLGFDELIDPAQWRRIRPSLTVRPQAGYNFNIMVPAVIAAILDVDAAGMEAVLSERAERSIRNLDQIRRLTGKIPAIDEEEIVTMPSRAFRITIWREGRVNRVVLGIRLTPFGQSAPWRKDYQYSEQILDHGSTAPRGAETTLF